jgi:hypothetical protein
MGGGAGTAFWGEAVNWSWQARTWRGSIRSDGRCRCQAPSHYHRHVLEYKAYRAQVRFHASPWVFSLCILFSAIATSKRDRPDFCAPREIHVRWDTMAAAEAVSSVSSIANSSPTSLPNSSDALPSAVAALQAVEQSSSTFGFLARVILTVLRVLPGTLYWIITFTTITLPTWLFTLFSMSLTFTMNFTTL